MHSALDMWCIAYMEGSKRFSRGESANCFWNVIPESMIVGEMDCCIGYQNCWFFLLWWIIFISDNLSGMFCFC